ncbi:putative O-methyltransferase [Hypoxylon trugodes]|uniref:putative O-methyltransferase n=1 Tax=Hypoxylon trugodes TaxID=326681 RepID=UPI0021991F81|nr:putative O-methyltransferase [Hypoxylon trugodes]KAI1386837.1 putative O-methyltransferase [Hypoxylon trugodes]
MSLINADVSQAVTLIEQLSVASPKLSSGDQTARKEALELSRKVTASLEQPGDAAVGLAFAPFITIAARIAVGLGLFKHVVNYGDAVTSEELASLSGGEELLIIRVLRPLSAIGFVEEVGERKWKATPITNAMATDEIAAGHRMIGEMIIGAATKGPKYLEEVGYRCPTDPHDGFMQYAFQTKFNVFGLFNSMPRVLNDFNLFMGNTLGARNYWVDWYPIEEQLLNEINAETPLLVDVGAGKGHDLIAFREKYPNHEGRLILQDIAPVIDNIQGIDPDIELMTYDFFSEQPVKGARSYFFHHILHDWSNYKCLEILKNVKKAIKPGYSKLLLHEMILAEQGAPVFHAMLDMTMMAFNSGMERTQRQWKELLEEAGLEVVKFWLPPQEDADGIVEAMLKE